jgi:chromosome segregation ATPase
MGSLRTLLAAKKNAANDAIDAWSRFLAAQAVLSGWTAEKTEFLGQRLTFQSLAAARSSLADYTAAVKSIKSVAAKAEADMGRELGVITKAGCAAGNLGDLLSEAERERGEVAARLEARAALLTELCEEWDQCARKLAEAAAWAGKTRDSLSGDLAGRRPLRDRLAMREKAASDVAIQRRRAAMAWEKLQVHFNTEEVELSEEELAGLDVATLGREIDAELAALSESTREQARTLEACLVQLEKYQQARINQSRGGGFIHTCILQRSTVKKKKKKKKIRF